MAMQLYEKETPTQVFSCEYCEIFKNTYFEEYLHAAVTEIQILLHFPVGIYMFEINNRNTRAKCEIYSK